MLHLSDRKMGRRTGGEDEAGSALSLRTRLVLGALSLAIAAAVWLPAVHLFFPGNVTEYFTDRDVAPKARQLADYHLHLWEDPALRKVEVDKMRSSCEEWDFMGRTFLVCALANLGMRQPESKDEVLDIIDTIIEDTLRIESEKGPYHFLMPYARYSRFRIQPARSVFIDGEIALMLAVRRVLEEKEAYRPLLLERVRTIIYRMKQSPVLVAESYPDECWIFCNTIALAAIRIADFLDGTDRSAFLDEWVRTAKEYLVDPETGLLISSCTVNGEHMDGPEGSTLWMACHCLQLIDEDFARDQYERAAGQLRRSFLGFGYAREWPPSWVGPQDVDSGPVIPVLEASPASSGLAFIGGNAFKDAGFLSSLVRSLEFAGLPRLRDGRLKYCASNQVGDAVMLYAMLQGPVWDKVSAGRAP